ncbi:MAG: hypothetical protein RJA81_777 [Planctomycetota bacterium]
MITEIRSYSITTISCMMVLFSIQTSANANGWWNHKSVVAIPTGPSVGTVQGAAPYQLFTAPTSPTPGYSYSNSPPANYGIPAYAPAMIYAMPYGGYGNSAASQQSNAFSAIPQNAYGDLGKQIADAIRQSQSQAPTAQSTANNGLTPEEVAKLRELLQKATSQQGFAVGQAPPAPASYVPVFIGYGQPTLPQQAIPTQQQAAPPALAPASVGTMSLVPVQLYRQKSFLGHDKLKPVRVYPYGIR